MPFGRTYFGAVGLAILAVLTAGRAILGGVEIRLALPPETARFKPAPGVEIAAAQCLICHSADYVSTQPRMGRAFWKSNVQKMQQKYGAPIPDNQVDRVVEYLVQAYGKE